MNELLLCTRDEEPVPRPIGQGNLLIEERRDPDLPGAGRGGRNRGEGRAVFHPGFLAETFPKTRKLSDTSCQEAA
ncbi:hypothetical protein PXK00_15985 [Phaeobacter sp. QD34_3]|uniref:hypothetical protein n=1 Tax=unclassified Phaeobacter TaxID=2621772 RepID=UPI00237F9F04|nr:MULTISPECIES: hypothetical protein [unclassified Phaeobacter]MDE4134620.1 hypothetical protein [Phaeobacter sp. QD34_3]MDE4138279.1 hypothetical protein [Phaeobacter sp. QD34_24]